LKTEKEITNRQYEINKKIQYLAGELSDMSLPLYEADTLRTLLAHFKVERQLLKWILDTV